MKRKLGLTLGYIGVYTTMLGNRLAELGLDVDLPPLMHFGLDVGNLGLTLTHRGMDLMGVLRRCSCAYCWAARSMSTPLHHR